jgi:hypothetical protein
MRRTRTKMAVLLALLTVCGPVHAAKLTFGSGALLRMVAGDKRALVEVSDNLASTGRAIEAVGPFQLEAGSLQRWLAPGWHRLSLRVYTAAPPREADVLTFAFSCHDKARTPETFRYETTFSAGEFALPGRYGELTRTLFIGPGSGTYSLTVHGFKGLRVESLSLVPLNRTIALEQVRTDKILYGSHETGTVAVHVLNGTGRPQTGRLTVTVESGLDDSVLLYDREVTVAGATPGQADVIELFLPPQPEYGHAVVATLSQGGTEAGTARDYFYTTDRPARVGHLGYMGIDAAYGPGNAAAFVEKLRRHCFPMYEIIFWAPDDALELVPPHGKNRWWSGQTLARMSTDSLKERIRLGHEQGMKVLAYTDLRYDFGYRIIEDLRRRPEFCEWDANNNDQSYSVRTLRLQAREDDAERFDPAAPDKPKFKAQGVWRLASGNPAVVDAHIDQLVRSTKFFGWDGWRYDDRYDYDEPAVDLLGRRLPEGGWRNPAIVARIRAALEKTKPGIIYGHNLEWAQDQPEKADVPMPLDTAPHANDYYTEFLRDGGLHLQERWLAHVIERHAPWAHVRDYLLALGHNAYRRGGYAYGLSYVNKARPADTRHLIAMHFAALTHLAGDVRDGNIGQMRLACRYADLLFGDRLVPLLDGERLVQVESGGKPLWWQRYVRYREVAPGRRVYLVHLINPPRNAKVGTGDPELPDPVTNIALAWKLPPGWKATRAYQLSGEGDKSVETVVSADARTCKRTDVACQGLVRQELPVREEHGSTRVTLPTLDVWSVVALDCRGPESDVAPDVRFPLPPPPATATDMKWEEARGYSPNRIELVYDISDPKEWTRPDPTVPGKRIPLEAVLDAGAATRHAARCVDGWELGATRTGAAIQGGVYRFRFRVKCTASPPPNAHLFFSAWSPPQHQPSWRINQSIPLDGLAPEKGWQTLEREYELGFARDSFGLLVKNGFDALLIDQIKVEEIRRWPESERVKARNLVGWPSGLGLTPHSGLRVWLGDGLYSEYYHFEEALRAIPDVTITRAPHWTYRDKRGFNGAGWTKPQDLADYDLIVLANVDLRTFPLEQRVWLRSYVEAGGSLLMTGGPYGLGRGGWQESDSIEQMLPAKLHDYDLRPVGVGNPLPLRSTEGGFLADRWTERPVTFWLHEVEAKPGSVVQLKAGELPALITGTAGKGRVAILAITPLGEVPADALGWWQWPGWEQVMTKTAEWLLKKR